MRILGLTGLNLAAAWLAMGATVLNAQSLPSQNARLAIRGGIVEVQRGNMWLQMASGEILNAGEHVRTGAGSSAAVEVPPRTVITLNELSQISLGESGTPAVRLEAGSMKVFTASHIKVAAKETVLESAGQPVELELGFVADKLNLRVLNGAVQNRPMMIHGGTQDPSTRTFTANGRSGQRHSTEVSDPTFYVSPYFSYEGRDANAGAIVPPVVINPTNPGYRPTQIVPPMSDPIRVPVKTRVEPAQARREAQAR